jgi:ferredoxin
MSTYIRRGPRLAVNMIACDGRGLCAEVLPELVTLDDWGFPIIERGELPPALQGQAREAIRLCPRLALRLDG